MKRLHQIAVVLITVVGFHFAESSMLRAAEVTVDSPGKANVMINWDKVVRVSKITPTLVVNVTPLLRRASPIHGPAFRALRDLQCDYVRYGAWYPLPKFAVAELDPPRDGKTSWDFSLIDPVTVDFLEATAGHPVYFSFPTIPQWMFKTEKPISYPDDPNQNMWDYEQGTELRDPSMKEVADYFARFVSWYTNGGFQDEYGKWHHSGHHFKIDYWGVLNEVDSEHQMTPEKYTALYDAIVAAIRRVAPQIKFVGVELAQPSATNHSLAGSIANAPQFFEYFLNPKNHKPGIPLDVLAYHIPAHPTADQAPDVQPFAVFAQADKFLDVAGYIESIRQRLSPKTKTAVSEINAVVADEFRWLEPGYVFKPIPDSYWNLSGALFAYLYAELGRLGIDIAAACCFAQYPEQFASITLLDWNTGQPNARYWVLKLLRDNFGPGDKLVETYVHTPPQIFLPPYVYARGFLTHDGKRKILLVNKRDRTFEVTLPGTAGALLEVVDQITGSQPSASRKLNGDTVTLGGLAVAVVTLAP